MQSLITFAASHTKLQTEAILALGELVKKPVLEQMEEAGRRRGRSMIGDDILFISVPRWLYDALAAVEKREVPTIIGRPLEVGPSEEIVTTFRDGPRRMCVRRARVKAPLDVSTVEDDVLANGTIDTYCDEKFEPTSERPVIASVDALLLPGPKLMACASCVEAIRRELGSE